MLGAIIGDIAGSRFEFNPTNDYNFELLSKQCAYTDDTICTVAVADAILNGEDYGSTIHRWCRKYPNPKGSYGGSFQRWVASDNLTPYGSFGNGAAMRVSPVAWAFTDRETVLENAKSTAECTHNHPEGIKGAQTTALAIFLALETRRNGMTLDVEAIIDECIKFSGYNHDIRESAVRNKFDETCQGTVPVALWIIRQSTSFEDAIRRAVSLGADADTLGAIVGSMAEAIWGIPQKIADRSMVYLPTDMKNVIDCFTKRYNI
ncbi:MAG: ADP-ribosylglycohydrolase family protein [Muribaculaceae bacterium]|nr:ADP-ribosylglycohydrolase family protein [Muribaculaceae bacterium]